MKSFAKRSLGGKAMAYLNSRPRTPEICPVCGESVPPNALACPECGACHNSGWREGALHEDGLDLPDEDFDYEQFLKDEFEKPRASHIHPVWWWSAIVVIIVFVALALTPG